MKITLLLFVLFASLQFVHGQEFVIYVDALEAWWPPESIAACLGVPGYAAPNK